MKRPKTELLKKVAPQKPPAFAINLLRGTFQRLRLKYLESSGILEKNYLAAIGKGLQPYTILRYERILHPGDTIYPISETKYVTPETFAMHLEVLKESFNVLSFPDFLGSFIVGGEVKPKTVLITFDGGYIDFLANAFPLLKKHELPATLFVAPGFIGTIDCYWQDKLGVSLITIETEGPGISSIPILAEQYSDLFGERIPDPSKLLALISRFLLRLHFADSAQRSQILQAVGEKVMDMGGYPVERAFLDWNDLVAISKTSIDIGLHNYFHRRVTELEENDFADELSAAFSKVSEENIKPLPVFAFPEGLVNEHSLAVLSAMGVRWSVGLLDISSPTTVENHLHLPRVPLYEQNSKHKELFIHQVLSQGGIL